MAKFVDFVNNNMSTYGAIIIVGKSNDLVVGNFTFVEEGCGKVASCVGTYNFNNPENHEFYAFHSKDKLDKMMIEILSNPTGYKPDPDPKTWYKIPDAALKEWGPH